MEFYDVVKTRRSIRSFRKEPIPEESLTRLLNAARLAPSGSNRQFWKFYIVKSEEVKREIAENCGQQMWIAEAPMVIVDTGWELNYNRGGYMGEMSFIMDVTIAFTHLILAARAEELGTCWIGDFNNGALKKALNLPDDENVVAITPLGYPDEGIFSENTRRKNLEKIIVRV